MSLSSPSAQYSKALFSNEAYNNYSIYYLVSVPYPSPAHSIYNPLICCTIYFCYICYLFIDLMVYYLSFSTKI